MQHETGAGENIEPHHGRRQPFVVAGQPVDRRRAGVALVDAGQLKVVAGGMLHGSGQLVHLDAVRLVVPRPAVLPQ